MPAVEALIATLEGDEKTGAKIVLRALEEPVRQIAANAGLEGSVIILSLIHISYPLGAGYSPLSNGSIIFSSNHSLLYVSLGKPCAPLSLIHISELVDSCILKLKTEFGSDNSTACKNCDIL